MHSPARKGTRPARVPEQHISAGTPRARRHAHTPEAPVVAILGLVLIAALAWVLWGVRLVRDAGPSGLGTPPEVCGRWVRLRDGSEAYFACDDERLDLRVTSPEPTSGER